MKNKLKQFFNDVINELINEGITNPVEMIAPLIYVLNQTQYQKLRGHIESSNEYQICYRNVSDGYNDGNLRVDFSFPTAKSKTYVFNFSSTLKGDYCNGNEDEEINPEWWNPSVNTTVSESVGVATWNGDKIALKIYVDDLKNALNSESEIDKLKNEIKEKQRQLAKLTA